MGKTQIEGVRQQKILLVEVAFDAAVPFGLGSGNRESGEEFGDGARGQGPVDLSERLYQIIRRHVPPIHPASSTRIPSAKENSRRKASKNQENKIPG